MAKNVFNKLEKFNRRRKRNKLEQKVHRRNEVREKKASGEMGIWAEQVDRSINNLYTGLRPAGATKGLIVGGAVLNTAYQMGNIDSIVEKNRTKMEVAQQRESEEMQNLPSTFGDGSDYMSRIRDMQEQSDLVFAMHKLRGGRF